MNQADALPVTKAVGHIGFAFRERERVTRLCLNIHHSEHNMLSVH
jgi:hypothetical protein